MVGASSAFTIGTKKMYSSKSATQPRCTIVRSNPNKPRSALTMVTTQTVPMSCTLHTPINTASNHDTWKPLDAKVDRAYPVFRGDHGPTEPGGIDSVPLDYFDQLFDQTLVDLLVTETNTYAQQMERKQWDGPTDSQEMRAYLGILYLTGIHKLPHFNDYFSSDWVLGVPAVQQVFTQRRFWQLWNNLHLADNVTTPSRESANYDKLYKVRKYLDTLKCNFQHFFRIGQNCSVDEHMVKGKGRNPFKQYMPGKPVKRGTKIWELACSCCGYLTDFQIYTGATADGNPEHGLSHRVVQDLAQPNLSHKNHVLYVDNFFTGIPLARDLRKMDIYLVGTLRNSRKGYPDALKNSTVTDSMERGEYHSVSSEELSITLYKDTKMVSFLSNVHSSHGNHTVHRTMKNGEKKTQAAPPCLHDYNMFMGAVDKNDQLQKSYSIDRKSRRWWVRLFLGFLDAVMVNAYILYTESHKLINSPMPEKNVFPLSAKKFRCEVIHGLVGQFSCRKLPGPQRVSPLLVLSRGHESVDVVELEIFKKGR